MKNEKANLQKWQGRFFKLSSFVLVGFIIWIFILICRYLHQIASTIGYSVLIAYLLIGLVDWVHSKARLRKRGLAILIVYIAIFFAFTAFALFVFPNLITQLQSLISQLPSYPQKMQTWLNTYNLKTAETGLDFLNINWEILSQQLTVYLNKTSSGFFSRLSQYGYDCWAVLEWECCIKSSEQGATEGAMFIEDHIIQVTERAFDDFAGGASDEALNKKLLGIQ